MEQTWTGGIHRSVARAAAWRLCSEVARRHPELFITEQHGGDGTYDEIVLHPVGLTLCGGHLRCNLAGSIHVFGNTPGGHWSWEDYLHTDPKRFTATVEGHLGLSAPTGVPTQPLHPSHST